MTPKAALWVVLLTIPISFGLKVFLPGLAFLDRMTITFIILVVVAIVLSLNESIEYKMDLSGKSKVTNESLTVFNIGSFLIIAIIAGFYIIFW